MEFRSRLSIVPPLLLIVAAGAFCWWTVQSTYYLSDDFMLMYKAVSAGPDWGEWSRPIFGHFVAGMLAVFWVVGSYGSLEREPTTVVMVLCALTSIAALAGISYQLQGRANRMMSLRVIFPAVLSFFVSIAVVPMFSLARGAATLPIATLTLLAVLSGLLALQRRAPLWWSVAGVLVVFSFPFWELATLNAVIVPLVSLALWIGHLRSGKALWDLGRRKVLISAAAYLVPTTLGLIAYLDNYRFGGYGTAGVSRPSIIEIAQGVGDWLIRGILPSFGGGPLPRADQGIGLAEGSLLSPNILLPLLVGLVVVALGLRESRTRLLTVVVLAICVLQGVIIMYARLRLEGISFVSLSPRYYADLMPFYQVLMLALWVTAVQPGRSTRRWSNLIRIAALAIAFVLTLWTWILLTMQFGGSDRAAYIARATAELFRAPQTSMMLASPASPKLGWMTPPWDNTEVLLYPALGDGRWRIGDVRKPLALSADGHLVTPRLSALSRSPEGSSCTTTLQAPVVQTSGLKPEPITILANITASREGSSEVWLNDEVHPISLSIGNNVIAFQTYWWGSMRVQLGQEEQNENCLRDFTVYRLDGLDG